MGQGRLYRFSLHFSPARAIITGVMVTTNDGGTLRRLKGSIEALEAELKSLTSQAETVRATLESYRLVYERERQAEMGNLASSIRVYNAPDRGTLISWILRDAHQQMTSAQLSEEVAKHDAEFTLLLRENPRKAKQAITAAIRYYNEYKGGNIKSMLRSNENYYWVEDAPSGSEQGDQQKEGYQPGTNGNLTHEHEKSEQP